MQVSLAVSFSVWENLSTPFQTPKNFFKSIKFECYTSLSQCVPTFSTSNLCLFPPVSMGHLNFLSPVEIISPRHAWRISGKISRSRMFDEKDFLLTFRSLAFLSVNRATFKTLSIINFEVKSYFTIRCRKSLIYLDLRENWSIFKCSNHLICCQTFQTKISSRKFVWIALKFVATKKLSENELFWGLHLWTASRNWKVYFI